MWIILEMNITSNLKLALSITTFYVFPTVGSPSLAHPPRSSFRYRHHGIPSALLSPSSLPRHPLPRCSHSHSWDPLRGLLCSHHYRQDRAIIGFKVCCVVVIGTRASKGKPNRGKPKRLSSSNSYTTTSATHKLSWAWELRSMYPLFTVSATALCSLTVKSQEYIVLVLAFISYSPSFGLSAE